ncbi:MAG: hypothetical protein ABIK56_01390 [candidate division WOR-3 bacterium]
MRKWVKFIISSVFFFLLDAPTVSAQTEYFYPYSRYYYSCWACDGYGWVICYQCNGTGIGFSCFSCNGLGYIYKKCYWCKGTGQTSLGMTCFTCDGLGFTCEKCYLCNGRGGSSCWTCNGLGWRRCSWCKGRGYIY